MVHVTKVLRFVLSHMPTARRPLVWFALKARPDEWRLFIRLQMNGGFSIVFGLHAASRRTFFRHSFQNARFTATQFVVRQFRKTNAPHIALVTYRPSHHAVHHPTLFMIITRQTFKKRRCALQHISDSRRVAQNVGALDSKSQFAAATACACGGAAAKCPSLKSSVPRHAAGPPQPCTPWRLAWYAG